MSSKRQNLANQALIQDETLLAICMVLENGWPAGPCFQHALNTLIETVVLHEKVYFDVRREYGRSDLRKATVGALLKESSFVRLLVDEKVVCELPCDEDLDALLVAQTRDYDHVDFLTDVAYSDQSFAYASPEAEANRLMMYLDVVNTSVELLKPQTLVAGPYPDSDDIEVYEGGKEFFLTLLGRQIGLSDEDLIFIEGLNRRAKGFLDLARHAGLHLQPFYLALPHQLGAIHSNNAVALRLWQQLNDRFNTLEFESAEETNFRRQPIPLLSEVLLGRCKDSQHAIGLELLNLRHDHTTFRNYLTEYELRWNAATSKRERTRMRNDFDQALEKLLEREKHASTRVIYTLWDLIKEPTKMLKTLGDKLADKGRSEYIIQRVRGLHDFWADLANSPPAGLAQEQFRRLFPNRVDESTWELGEKFAETVNSKMVS
ncbi:MAG: hypothetical protein ACJ74Z_11015 [Bryobacteraceae bacterium]